MAFLDQAPGLREPRAKVRGEEVRLPAGTSIRIVPYPTPESPLQRILALFEESAETDAKAAMTAIAGSTLPGGSGAWRVLAHQAWAGPLMMPPILVNGR